MELRDTPSLTLSSAAAPTADELLAAARWTRTQDPSEGFRFNLAQMLTHLGHGKLADQL